MNTPSPLIPQGTKPAKGKVSFFVKVLMILALHVVIIGGMLLQGCKDTKDTTATPPPDSGTSTADTTPVNPGISNAVTTAAPAVPQAPPSGPGAPATPPQAAPQPAPAPMPAPVAPITTAPTPAPGSGETHEYVIASGDTLGALAKKNGVSLKALMEANAGINPKKLQVGQKIQIPAGSGATAGGATSGGVSAPDASGDTESYTVKTGDTLSKIAKANHTSYKKIMALNDLKTTSIKVGQKLKLPAPKASEAPVVPTAPATTTVPTLPPPAAPAAPTSTTASNQ